MEEHTLFEQVKNISQRISTDAMGGSPVEKCFVMAYLAKRLELKNYVEIGVYRGKSLFSVAPAFIDNGGHCYGIDPWEGKCLKEEELPDTVKQIVDDFADTADFDAIYNEVLQYRSEFGMNDTVTLLRDTSENAMVSLSEALKRNADSDAGETNCMIDMLHIDGNHDYKYVRQDVALYAPCIIE